MISTIKKVFLKVIIFIFNVFPFYASAAVIKNPIKAETFNELVEKALNVVLQIGVPVAALFIIYSGFLFVKSRGNPEELTKAKNTFVWTIVGTAILLGAWVLAQGLGATINSLKL